MTGLNVAQPASIENEYVERKQFYHRVSSIGINSENSEIIIHPAAKESIEAEIRRIFGTFPQYHEVKNELLDSDEVIESFGEQIKKIFYSLLSRIRIIGKNVTDIVEAKKESPGHELFLLFEKDGITYQVNSSIIVHHCDEHMKKRWDDFYRKLATAQEKYFKYESDDSTSTI